MTWPPSITRPCLSSPLARGRELEKAAKADGLSALGNDELLEADYAHHVVL